jgi:hypothetical protein
MTAAPKTNLRTEVVVRPVGAVPTSLGKAMGSVQKLLLSYFNRLKNKQYFYG